MTDLVKYETVDGQTAAKLAALYVGSFHYAPHNVDVMLEQVTRWCMGKPISVIQHICHPEHGAVKASKDPCLKALNDWYDAWTQPKRPPREAPEHTLFLPEPNEPQEPLEVRQAAVDRWRKVKPLIGAAVESNCVGRPNGWKPSQKAHGLDELTKRLER